MYELTLIQVHYSKMYFPYNAPFRLQQVINIHKQQQH